jgi:hypothetical protein
MECSSHVVPSWTRPTCSGHPALPPTLLTIKGEGEDMQSNLTLEEVEILISKIPIGGCDIVDFEETIVVDIG